MKKPNDVDRLNHILDSIAKIERFCKIPICKSLSQAI